MIRQAATEPCELHVQVLQHQYDDYDAAEDRAVIGTTDLRLVCDVTVDATVHWTVLYSRYGRLYYEGYELNRLVPRDRAAFLELLANVMDRDDVEERYQLYVDDLLHLVLEEVQDHEGVEIIPRELMYEDNY